MAAPYGLLSASKDSGLCENLRLLEITLELLKPSVITIRGVRKPRVSREKTHESRRRAGL